MPFDFSFFGGKKEHAEVSSMDIERQLEKIPTELADKIYNLRNSLATALNDRTYEDGRLLDEVAVAAAAEGLDETAVRNFILDQEEVVVQENVAVENMQITSYEAVATLFTENETVASLVERVRDGDMTLQQLHTALQEAGYETDEHFSEYAGNYLDATAGMSNLAAQ